MENANGVNHNDSKESLLRKRFTDKTVSHDSQSDYPQNNHPNALVKLDKKNDISLFKRALYEFCIFSDNKYVNIFITSTLFAVFFSLSQSEHFARDGLPKDNDNSFCYRFFCNFIVSFIGVSIGKKFVLPLFRLGFEEIFNKFLEHKDHAIAYICSLSDKNKDDVNPTKKYDSNLKQGDIEHKSKEYNIDEPNDKEVLDEVSKILTLDNASISTFEYSYANIAN